MNILPKKRWHVRNKDNVARVRRDEENARLQEIEKEKRQKAAETEIRLKKLRGNDSEAQEQSQSKVYHVNFFTEFEQEVKQSKKASNNDQYTADKKAEQESFEKRIGLLTYLGQSVVETEEPWYLTPSKLEQKQEANPELGKQDEHKKETMDPIRIVDKHLKRKREKKESKKEKKRKEEKKEVKSGMKDIEKLREERVRREKAERERAKRLLSMRESHTESQSDTDYDPLRYSSQYHPHIARQPRR